MAKQVITSRIAMMICTWLCAGATAHAAILVNEAHVVAVNDGVAATVPAPSTFDVAIGGDYTITLTDVGKQVNGGAYAFQSLSLAVYQDSQLIKVVPVAEDTMATSQSSVVTLAPGSYGVQVLGVTAGASLYSVSIASTSNTVFSTAGAITAASSSLNNDLSVVQPQLSLVAGHSYSISASDIGFPVALDSLNVAIVVDGLNLQCPLTMTSPGPCSFVAGNTNKLNAIASKAADAVAGMYSIKIVDNTDGSVVLASTYPVGNMPDPASVSLPANGAYQLVTTDLRTPDPLNNLQTLLLQDVTILSSQNAAGTSQLSTFNASAGMAKLYVIGNATGNGGIYGVQVSQGSSVVYSNASAVSSGDATTQTGYFFNATLPAAGNYVLALGDLNFPQSFSNLSAAVTQGGTTIGTLSASGTLTLDNASAGDIQINIIATPNDAGQGLFGLKLSAAGSSNLLLNVTQGVGGSFLTIPVDITTAGTYNLKTVDMQAPQHLGQLLVAVTRDTQFIGEVIGGSSVNVDATPGNYVLNVIATTDAATGVTFGMYGVAFGNAPSLTLTSSATSVTSGSTVFLNWSSSDTSSCIASDDWSGSKAMTGNESFGPVLTDVKLTLTCSGVTGSVSKSVNVQVKAAASDSPPAKSGGGALQWWMLAVLLLLAGQRIYKREKQTD